MTQPPNGNGGNRWEEQDYAPTQVEPRVTPYDPNLDDDARMWQQSPDYQEPAESHKMNYLVLVTVGLATLILGLLLGFFLFRGSSSSDDSTTTTSIATTTTLATTTTSEATTTTSEATTTTTRPRTTTTAPTTTTSAPTTTTRPPTTSTSTTATP